MIYLNKAMTSKKFTFFNENKEIENMAGFNILIYERKYISKHLKD
jgi:hypothetical protein